MVNKRSSRPSQASSFIFSRLTRTLVVLLALVACAHVSARAATVTVPAGGSLQAAIDAAQPGDTILLQSGATYTGPFTLRNKQGTNTDADWITIRTDAPDSQLPAPGTRMTPAYSPVLAKLLSHGLAEAAVQTEPGAHHYRFVAVEFGRTSPDAIVYDLIKLGDGSPAQNTAASVPHHFQFDRCYIHGDTGDLKRGISLQSGSTDITNSYVSEFHVRGQEAQAIAGWNGPGPYNIVNNYLEGAGENIIFGGAMASVPLQTPSDIRIVRNHLRKPPEWRGVWTVKNLLELKHARRVTIDGNLMEGNWPDAQSGFSILFTPRPNDSGAWAVVEDVAFTNNIVRHISAGLNFLGEDYAYQPAPTENRMRRVRVYNNLFEDVGGQWGGNGAFAQILTGSDAVTIDHNTVLQTGSMILLDGPPSTNVRITNNVARHNDYGVFGSGVGYGNSALTQYLPGGVFTSNAVAKEFNAPWNADLVYPAGNFFPATMNDVGFADLANGDYRLAASSPYKHAATDGADLGCDVDAIKAAMGVAPSPTPTPTPNATPTPSPTPTATPTPSPTPTPNPTPAPGGSLALVTQAQTLAAALSGDPSSGAQQIAPLVAAVEQAYAVFTTESGRYASAAQVDTSLRAALYFARASLALATAEGASGGVQSRLQVASSQLALARDLMGGSAVGENVSGANPASVTRTNIIGVAATASAASLAPALAPESLGFITGDPAQSPLALDTAVAKFDAARPPFELDGVSVTVAGRAAQILSVSPSRVGFVVPAGLPAGDAEVIVTLQQGYVSRGTVTISQVAPGIFTSDGSGAGGALVLNAADYSSGSFDVWTQRNFSTDKHTRLMIFATGLRGAANTSASNDVAGAGANLAESVVVEARLQNNLVYQLPVEYAGAAQTGAAGVDQINVILPSFLMQAGQVDLTITVNGQRSNTASITVR